MLMAKLLKRNISNPGGDVEFMHKNSFLWNLIKDTFQKLFEKDFKPLVPK